jgi:LysR family hydrogen peroxide-inducible transcriptional activator
VTQKLVRDLVEGRLVLLLEEGQCFRDQAISLCKLPRILAGQIMEGSSLSTLVQMVAAGLGVTLIPEMAAPLEMRSATVAIDRLQSPRPGRRIGFVWRRSNPLADRLAELARALQPPDPLPHPDVTA